MEEADSIVKKIPRGNKDDRRQRKVGKGKSRDVSRKEKNYDEEDLSADLDDPSSDGKGNFLNLINCVISTKSKPRYFYFIK